MARLSLDWAAPRRVPWFLITTVENISPGLPASELLDPLGLVPVMNLTGMLAGDVNPPAQLPDGLALTSPNDDDACAQFVHLNQAAYGMDMQCLLPYVGAASFWHQAAGVVGNLGELPVSCSAVLPVDGYHYVALVATHPDHRRRGYADAAMRQSLALATDRFGRRPTFLHATDAGRPVYELMGYRSVATHVVYMEKQYLAAH
jgi:GNAT superfamily N-acetyltransferase